MAEWISENINGRNRIRKIYHMQGVIHSTVAKGKEEEGKTYQQYFDWSEPIGNAPSHRILALFRAEEEGMLKVKIDVDDDFVLNSLDDIFLRNDNASTALVQDAIDNLMKDRTVFAIAHRLSTIRGADLILVMQDGAIVERGTHDELYAADGVYRRLCDMQKAG